MNNFLVDTHVFLWLLFSPEKLKKSILTQLMDRTNQVFVSVVSFWEISLKYQLGKLNLTGVLPHELLESASQMGLDIAQVSPSEFATFYQLPILEGHKDPFDRLIIWQCHSQEKILVSHDNKMSAYVDLGLQILK